MRALIVAALMIAAGRSAANMPNEQFDWSGGPGVPGPVYWFGDTFDSCQGIDWSDTPGFIFLAPSDTASGQDYVPSGSLVSSILEIPMGVDYEILWGDIWWESYQPPGTKIVFQLRVGYDPLEMLEWTDTIPVSGTPLDPLLPNDVFFLQYRAILLTDDSQVSPGLDTAVIEGWYPGSVASGTVPVLPHRYLAISHNPSSDGTVSIKIGPGIHGDTRVEVFDMAGRLMSVPLSGTLSGESVSAVVSGLRPGVYLAVLESGDVRAVARALVIPPR